MIGRVLTRLGLTRDALTWLWLKIIGIASLVASSTFDLQYWLTYLGLHVSEAAVHRIIAGAGVLLYLGGQYSSSSLFTKAELRSATVPKEEHV